MEFKNDLGKPWKYEDGDFTVVRTSMWSPPGCHPVGCGLKLYVDAEGRLDHVEGDENNPITKGRLCARCLALKDYVYNPSRVIYPMKRDPKDRGQHDKWERITWDEAYALIKEKRDYFRDTYGPESMAVFSGTGRSGGILVADMAQAVLGTPNACYTQSGYACYQPRSMSCSHVLGAYYPEMDYAGGLEGTYDNPVYRVPEVIVMWGKMALASNGDGLWGHAVIDLMKRGAKLISVDPRVNWLATRAEVHLRVRPGTDTALAMAWLSIIINEDLYDHDFVEKWTYGFEEFSARINDPDKGMTPERAAEICEVPVEDIYRAARLYAAAKPASIAWGLAFDQNQNGNQAAHCVLALMAICGNIDVPGGQIIAEIDPAPGVEDDAEAQAAAEAAAVEGSTLDIDKADDTSAEDAARPQRRIGWDSLPDDLKGKTIGYDEYPLYVDNIRNAQADMMFDAVTKGEPYRIRMGWIQSTALLTPTCCAQPTGWYEGCKNLEWCMATDCFITPAIEAFADLVLPLASCAEKDDVVMTHYAGSPVTLGSVNKAVDVGEVKSDIQILIELGEYLEMDCLKDEDGGRLFKDEADFLTQRRARPAKMPFEDLRDQVVFQRGVNYRKYETGKLRPDRLPHAHRPRGAVVDGVRALRRGPSAVLPGAGVQSSQGPRAGGEVPVHPDHGSAQLRVVPRRAPADPRAPRAAPRPDHRDQPRGRGAGGRGRRPVGRDQKRLRPREVQGRRVAHREEGRGADRPRLVVPRAPGRRRRARHDPSRGQDRGGPRGAGRHQRQGDQGRLREGRPCRRARPLRRVAVERERPCFEPLQLALGLRRAL